MKYVLSHVINYLHVSIDFVIIIREALKSTKNTVNYQRL